MRFVIFCHSLRSDWNHGNAHFLRGIARELVSRGHRVDVFEPADAWSVSNLVREHGEEPLRRFDAAYPELRPIIYHAPSIDLERALDGSDVVLVHEWNDPRFVRRVGQAKRPGSRLFFHDTHHRTATRPAEMRAYDLSRYDGVLAFGNVVRDRYKEQGWAHAAWTWHEAADTRLFRPPEGTGENGLGGNGGHAGGDARRRDLVWIGNWGDDERTGEISEFLLDPVRDLRLDATAYGVRYPEPAKRALADAGIEYGGWLPNFDVPRTFGRHRMTVHVPRAPYARALPGIPTIRVFEALACGIPLVSAPWEDAEGLFTAGRDYLVARDGREMSLCLNQLRNEPETARALADHGQATIRARHTCRHRVDQLFDILREAGFPELAEPEPATAAAHDGDVA